MFTNAQPTECKGLHTYKLPFIPWHQFHQPSNPRRRTEKHECQGLLQWAMYGQTRQK
jgi:hypothetical protein